MDPLLARFLDLAREDPDALALVGKFGEWTRADMAGRVERLGEEWRVALARRDLGAGAVVALCVSPGPGFLAAFLACRMAEVCVLLMDSSLTCEEQTRVAKELGATCRWSSSDAEQVTTLDENSLVWLEGRTHLPDACCLKLTSGSSGQPAGVVVPPDSLIVDGLALIKSMGLRAEDRILAAVPMSHAYGLSVIASPVWLLGCTVVIPESGLILQAAEQYAATVLPSVPGWYEGQLAAASPSALPESLRLMMSAGAPLRPATAQAWQERHGQGIHVLYGSSECGGITYDRRGDAAARGSVGTALEGVRIELDGQQQVIVHSGAVALGYWPEDDARAQRLSPGCFRTEDIAELQGEELHLRGRRSHWINVKGKKVDPHEIERVLVEHPEIREVAVVGRPLPEGRGEAIRAVVACAEDSLRFRDVVTWCKPRLARHKYPRSVVLVRELPRTARGKLDRQALLAL